MQVLGHSEDIAKLLKDENVNFFVTYPCAKIQRLYNLIHMNFQSVGVTKEEEGVGICAGAYLAGAKPAMLIQSTGLGNMINALCSLTLTYNLPLPILASWRGVYKEKIPAQIPLGKSIPKILQAIGVDYHIITNSDELTVIRQNITEVYSQNKPHVFLLSPQIWEDDAEDDEYPWEDTSNFRETVESELFPRGPTAFTRYELLKTVAPFLDKKLVISNIGFPSRELYRVKHQPSNFYMLGSLGLASPIGLGVALSTPRQVVVVDGDGSLLSNLGSLGTIAQTAPPNLTILAIDNGVHGSTGDQLTATSTCVDLSRIAMGIGIQNVYRTSKRKELVSILAELEDGPNFVHMLAQAGNAQVPPLPLTPTEIRNSFMKEISEY